MKRLKQNRRFVQGTAGFKNDKYPLMHKGKIIEFDTPEEREQFKNK